PHCYFGAGVTFADTVSLYFLLPHSLRPAGPKGRGLRFDQHGDSDGVRIPGRREREAKDRLFAPAFLFALPWTQHCRPAGHFSLCGHSFG
ncbi:hypothetical protein M9458_004363, partial [Cirrhinus mrigala]